MSSRDHGFLLAGASGVLLVLSFPKFGHPAFGWIALAPLLLALTSGSLSRAFWLGVTAGLVYFNGTLYWIARVMAVYGGLHPALAIVLNEGLIAYLALFPALFAVIARRLMSRYGVGALLAAPFVWVATELGRTYILTGFPWVLLGYSQASVVPIVQLASVTGVYGLSALVASVSAVLVLAVVSGSPSAIAAGTSRRTAELRRQLAPAAVVFATILVISIWGSVRAVRAELTREGQPIRVGLVQGNVDQGEKWNAARAASIFDDYLRMTRQAIGQGADVVFWPESSTPFMFEEDIADATRIRTVARQARVPILLGSDQIEWQTSAGRRVPAKYFNAAVLVRADGSTAGAYRKMHLVPFGEYVPFQRLLFFATPLTEQVGTFSPGDDPTLLPLDGHAISVAICYEVVYPSLIRDFVRGGSELLATITNDAWFGRTSAPYQHFEQAAMRAVEEGRYLVRSANTGISGIVDPYGRVIARSNIYEPAIIVGEARFLRASTVYARIGDVFAYASVVATLVLLVAARRRVQ